MINTSDLFKERKFPDWFSNHSVFKTVKKIKKVFPGIGLPNAEEEVEINNTKPALQAAKQLVKALRYETQHRRDNLKAYIASKPAMSAARKEHGEKCLLLLDAVSSSLFWEKIVKEENGRFTLKLDKDITLNGQARPTFRENEGLFRVYNKLNELLQEGKFARLEKLEDLHQFKTFSTDNVPNSKFKIVFSSDGNDGAWDIATMSMRGVRSCQSWDGDYRHCTIGSVIDPFVGIIYLTSGARCEHGPKMMKRSIVRFVVDGGTNQPYLLLDNMYPQYDEPVFKAFQKLLKTKTGGKFEVRYAPNMDGKVLRETYMPLNDTRKLLRQTSAAGDTDYDLDDLGCISSYQDVRVQDKTSNKNDKHAALYEKNSKKKAVNFVKDFSAAFKKSIDATDIESVPDSIKPVFGKLKGTDKKNFNYTYCVPEISRIIGNGIVKSVDRKSFTSSDLFLRRLFQSYFNNKNKIFNELKTKLTREINSRVKPKNKFASENFLVLMKSLLPKIDEEMKKSLYREELSKKLVPPLPLP